MKKVAFYAVFWPVILADKVYVLSLIRREKKRRERNLGSLRVSPTQKR
jgi:hypothetical protein